MSDRRSSRYPSNDKNSPPPTAVDGTPRAPSIERKRRSSGASSVARLRNFLQGGRRHTVVIDKSETEKITYRPQSTGSKKPNSKSPGRVVETQTEAGPSTSRPQLGTSTSAIPQPYPTQDISSPQGPEKTMSSRDKKTVYYPSATPRVEQEGKGKGRVEDSNPQQGQSRASDGKVYRVVERSPDDFRPPSGHSSRRSDSHPSSRQSSRQPKVTVHSYKSGKDKYERVEATDPTPPSTPMVSGPNPESRVPKSELDKSQKEIRLLQSKLDELANTAKHNYHAAVSERDSKESLAKSKDLEISKLLQQIQELRIEQLAQDERLRKAIEDKTEERRRREQVEGELREKELGEKQWAQISGGQPPIVEQTRGESSRHPGDDAIRQAARDYENRKQDAALIDARKTDPRRAHQRRGSHYAWDNDPLRRGPRHA